MSQPFLAEIRMVGFNFAPRGWATCNGQLMPLSQNTALFSLLGTTYGGDGKSNFALPNLQDSTPISWGNGAGLTPRQIGESGGSSTVTLQTTEMAQHQHNMMAYTGDAGDSRSPGPTKSLALTSPGNLYNPSVSGVGQMNAQALGVTGQSLPHNNMMPYLTVLIIIALQGVYPQRS